MVVELVDLNLPCNLVLVAVLDLNGQISAVVESSELGLLNASGFLGTGLGLLDSGHLLGLHERVGLSSETFTLLQRFYIVLIEMGERYKTAIAKIKRSQSHSHDSLLSLCMRVFVYFVETKITHSVDSKFESKVTKFGLAVSD